MSKAIPLPDAQLTGVEAALSELTRELNVRERCFPNWIADGRLNRIDAIDRRDRLATAFKLLQDVADDATGKLLLDEAQKRLQAATVPNAATAA